MTSTLQLSTDKDLIIGTYQDGASTIAVSRGGATVAQSAAIAVSTKRGSVWFNLAAGIQWDGIFYNTNQPDSVMDTMRAQVIRDAMLAVPGVASLGPGPTFTRVGRTLNIALPCIQIDCAEGKMTADVEVMA